MDDTSDQTLEERAFQDLDAIALISKHALNELDTGQLDELEDSLRAIHDRAESWEAEPNQGPDVPNQDR